MKKELIVFKDPKSPISEIFRTLRTNIQFMNTKKNAKTILVTSTFAGEGKSWISSNLAVTFAQTGKKVLLIDADMRKGRQYTIFGVSPKPGLSNYLSGINLNDNGVASEHATDYIQKTEVPNLYVMAAGNIPPNPSELLISPQMVNLLEEVKELCDIIIIDGTPSQLVTDSLIIARMVDSTIVVTACKETKKEDLKRVIANIQNVGGKIAGVILNKIPISAKKYESRYYYYGSTSKEKSGSNSKFNIANLGNIRANNNNTTTQNFNQNNEANKNQPTQKEEVAQADKNAKVEASEEISLEKANDILQQINEYIEKEKKNLK